MSTQRRNDFLIPLLAVLLDIVAIEGAFILSYQFRFFSPLTSVFEVTLGVPPLSDYVVSSLVFIPIWLFFFKSRGMYGTRRNTHLSDEFFAIARVMTIGLLGVMSATFFYRGFSFSRGVFILLWIVSVVTVTLGRYLLMQFEQWLYRRGKELKTVVIVGNNETATAIYSVLMLKKNLGYHILGYYADSSASEANPLSAAKYLGPVKGLTDDLVPQRIQAAFIALTYKEHPLLLDLMRDLEGKNIELMMVPDLLEMITSNVRIQEMEGIPLIRIREIPLTTWNRITKRCFDIAFSACVLVCISPLLLLIALLVKLSSRGPVIFAQERIGLDGFKFPLYKFRTMRVDAETATGPIRATKGDQRTTGIGKFLRRTSLDELPQFFNVLTGQMSIVGPRPERPYFVEQFRHKIPRYLERHRMKTGMTGWAQVNGLRGNAPIEDRTKYDIYYIENWSLVFDIKIILKTIHAVVFGQDAY
ncbi:MAG: undecaprenyl-phosphate glucose phosphotransferase [Ignavibacteriales bacterium]|nr:undecaprenyl-phosphate glucose phosphotransferase [Ignavibacteriales bacterium]